jgi:hypothetical protein
MGKLQRQTQEMVHRGTQDIGSRYSKALLQIMRDSEAAALPYFSMYQQGLGRSQDQRYQSERMNATFRGQSMNEARRFNAGATERSRFANQQNPWLTTGFGILGNYLGGLGGAGEEEIEGTPYNDPYDTLT